MNTEEDIKLGHTEFFAVDAFPFTKDEWEGIRTISHRVLNATLANDDLSRKASFRELDDALNDLRRKYGEHPVLLETLADFEGSTSRQLKLYRLATQVAVRHGLPTRSIRVSLARILLEELGDGEAAAQELLACQSELIACSDEDEKTEWSELLARCRIA